jgi:hypothetical protein
MLTSVNKLLEKLFTVNSEHIVNSENIHKSVKFKENALKEIIERFAKVREAQQKIIKKINAKTTVIGGVFYDILQQINNMTVNALSNLENINQSYVQISALCDTSIEHMTKFSSQKTVTENLKKSTEKTIKIIDVLSKNNSCVNGKINENNDILIKITSEINSTTAQIKYYDLFEKIIIEIIDSLNRLISGMDEETLDFIRKNKSDNLAEFEKHYTMQTQRIIHQKVVNGDKDENIEKDTDENEITFF